MDIRFAQNEDVGGILNLLRQVGRVHHLGRPDLFRANAQKYGASQVLAMLENVDTPIFVAVEDEKVLGYCFCQVKDHTLDSVLSGITELYIDDLCVEETLRGQHIGTALFEQVCRYAKMRRCYNITLNVYSCNGAALHFYESMGMKTQKVGMEMILEEQKC